jgi:hypothetical protein
MTSPILAPRVLALGVLLAGFPLAPAAIAQPDPTPPARYLPLAVGNVWEYSHSYSGPYAFSGFSVRERIEVTEALDTPGRYRVRRVSVRSDAGGSHPPSHSSVVWYFDAKTSRFAAVEEGDEDEDRAWFISLCLNAPFSGSHTCGSLDYNMSGGQGQPVQVAGTALERTVKRFSRTPNLPRGYYHEATTWAEGLGRVSYTQTDHNGTDLRSASTTMTYARIGGEEYGTARLGVATEPGSQPGGQVLAVEAVHPHPVREAATLRLTIPEGQPYRLRLFDLLGRERAPLANGVAGPGPLAVPLDVRGLPAGVYLVRLEAGGVAHTRKLTVTR